MKKYKASGGSTELYNNYKEKLKLAQLANSEANKEFEKKLAFNIKKNSKISSLILIIKE